MSRFYEKNTLEPKNYVKAKSSGKNRRTDKRDAKKNDWLVSVTTIINDVMGISSGIADWQQNVLLQSVLKNLELDLLEKNPEGWVKHQRKTAKSAQEFAMKLGGRVHNTMEDYFIWRAEGGPDGHLRILRDVEPYITAADKFCDENNIVINSDLIEHKVEIPRARSAGTLDFVCSAFEEDLIIGDWKTNKFYKDKPSFRFSYWVQLGAYAIAVKEKFNLDKAPPIMLVLFDTSCHPYTDNRLPNVEYEIRYNSEFYYDIFCAFSKIYYAMNSWLDEEI